MGQAFSYRSMPPPDAVVVVIEPDDACSCVPLTGRLWNDHLARPDFVHLSEGEWRAFTTEVGRNVRSYKREGLGLLGIPLILISFVLFHPSFGVLSRQFEDNQISTVPMMLCIFLGVFLIIGLQMGFRKANEQIDAQIASLCQRNSGAASGATLQLVTEWTGQCKPKHARTYRALRIYPAGADAQGIAPPVAVGMAQPALPQVAPAPQMMLVNVPPGVKPGQTVGIQAPSGMQMQVVVPAGVPEGGQFQVALPPSQPVVVAAVPIDAGVSA